MESFKYQVGKDLSRVDINVNSIPLPKGIKVVLQNYTIIKECIYTRFSLKN